MDRSGTLKLFTAVSLLGGVCHCWEAIVQTQVMAIRGSCVLVPCSTVSYSKVIWYKYKGVGYPVVYSRDSSEVINEFKGRTSVLGSAQKGNCSLKIDNVQEQDGQVDLYVWIWKHDGANKGFYERTTKITVGDPGTPEISVVSKQTEGTEFRATCKCRHSCPSLPPQIAWLGLNVISNVLTSTEDSKGLWVTEATAKFGVTQADQNAKLSCTCVLTGASLSSETVSLDVLYAPKEVKIHHTGNSAVVEGDKISLACTSKSKPEPSDYEWRVNQTNPPVHSKRGNIVLHDVRRHTTVSCIAINVVGRGESEQLSLNVHYAPTDVKVDYTGSSSVVEGNKISLECFSKSSPAPTLYDWSVSRNITIRDRGKTFVLQDVMRNTSVSCSAANYLGRGESKQLLLDVHYSPSISSDSFCSMQNGTLHCVCQAEARPNPVISWTIDGSGALFPLYNTTTQQSGPVTVSQLMGLPAQNVTCTATNSAGTEFIQIPVLSKGNALAVSGIAGAAAGVCIMLGLAVIAIVIWKKRRHAEPCEGLRNGQQMKPDQDRHDYCMESDNDLYANEVHNQQAYKNEDAESCIYENYNKAS